MLKNKKHDFIQNRRGVSLGNPLNGNGQGTVIFPKESSVAHVELKT